MGFEEKIKESIEKKEQPAVPRDAATVILLRDLKDSFQVFMVRRKDSLKFMGGAHVFPGGRLDDADCAEELFGSCAGRKPGELPGLLNEEIDACKASGLFMAAIRETFEEAGVLLARKSDGSAYSYGRDEGRIRKAMADLHSGLITMKQMAESERILFALDMISPYARWITPEFERRRFDTRFLLARMPGGQEAFHDPSESTEGEWMSPPAALERHFKEEIMLMPPTFVTMSELAAFKTADELIASTRGKKINPIMPRFENRDGELILLFPGDADYPVQPGMAIKEGPTRLYRKDGKWELGTKRS